MKTLNALFRYWISLSNWTISARHWEADERASLSREKEESKKTTARLEDLEQKTGLTAEERLEVAQLRNQAEPKFGPVPESWAARYEAVLGRPFESERARSRSWQEERQTLNSDSSDRQPPPPPDIEIKRGPDLFDRGELDLFSQDLGLRLRHGSNSSLESDQKVTKSTIFRGVCGVSGGCLEGVWMVFG